ncbi:MAG: amino acid racemase [Gammaproteobacteria bacterium]|nr:amino acid racemase [Gammaproteobacteria bacterium]
MGKLAPRKTAGVLGGMGPQATVDFMQEVIRLTGARRDQDHVRMLVDCNPAVPDRQAALRGEGGDVAACLAQMARGLQAAGAEFLVMPCNTAHVFADSIAAAVPIPLINIIDATVAAVRRECPDARSVGLLATTGCINAGVYQRALASDGFGVVVPADSAVLMDLIFRIKSGDVGAETRAATAAVAQQLVAAGADVLIAGCTEIPLVLGAGDVPVPLISSTDVLARQTIEYAFNLQPGESS